MGVRRACACATAALAWLSCAGMASTPSDALPRFMEEFFAAWAQRDPEWLAEQRPFGADVDPEGDRWTDASLAAQQDRVRVASAALTRLRSYPISHADPDTRFPAEALEWYLDDVVRGGPFLLSGLLFDPYAGEPLRLIRFLTDVHPIRSPVDAENYVLRLEALGPRIEQLQDALRAREASGVIPPRPILDELIAGIDAVLAEPPAQSRLVKSLETRSARLEGVDPERRQGWIDAATRAVADGVQPALRRLRGSLEALRAKAPEQAGVWRQPDGEAYYAYLVRHYTTLDLEAKEIHARALREVEALQGQLRSELAALGFEAPGFGDALRAYHASLPVAEPDAGQALAAVRDRVAQASQHFSPEQVALPRGALRVEPLPAGREPGEGGVRYLPPSLDGLRTGVLFVDPAAPPPPATRQALVYHDAIPGHHVQLGLQREATELPTFSRLVSFPAFRDGWAAYAGGLALEEGLYTDAPSRIAALEAELLRAARAVVDTGIHQRRWWRQDALDWMRENLGEPHEADVDRCIARPGEALAEPVGVWHLREQRERAQSALGPRFRARRFHDAVLGKGGLPLPVLDHVVDDFIERER
jgi:uncharacterized protein (DUF885 family)